MKTREFSPAGQLRNRIDETLNDLTCQLYRECNIKTGDIAPEQALQWDSLVDQMTLLVYQLMSQNSGWPETQKAIDKFMEDESLKTWTKENNEREDEDN